MRLITIQLNCDEENSHHRSIRVLWHFPGLLLPASDANALVLVMRTLRSLLLFHISLVPFLICPMPIRSYAHVPILFIIYCPSIDPTHPLICRSVFHCDHAPRTRSRFLSKPYQARVRPRRTSRSKSVLFDDVRPARRRRK